MQEQKTLEDVQAGDEVAMSSGDGGYHILTVQAVSRGIITLKNGTRYRATNGTPLAKGERHYRPSSILPVTDSIRQAVKKAGLISKLSGLNYNSWKQMDVETLEAIAALVWKEQSRTK